MRDSYRSDNTELFRTRQGDWFCRAYNLMGESFEQYGLTKSIAVNNTIKRVKESGNDGWLIPELSGLLKP